MYSFQNGFHHEKGHSFLLKLGISALGHQISRLVTYIRLILRPCYLSIEYVDLPVDTHCYHGIIRIEAAIADRSQGPAYDRPPYLLA